MFVLIFSDVYFSLQTIAIEKEMAKRSTFCITKGGLYCEEIFLWDYTGDAKLPSTLASTLSFDRRQCAFDIKMMIRLKYYF